MKKRKSSIKVLKPNKIGFRSSVNIYKEKFSNQEEITFKPKFSITKNITFASYGKIANNLAKAFKRSLMYINKSPRRIDRKAGGRHKKIKIKSYPKTNKKQKRFSSK